MSDKDRNDEKREFKVMSDAEAKAHGLPTEPTMEDIVEGNRAREVARQQSLVDRREESRRMEEERREPRRGYPQAPQPASAFSPLIEPEPPKYSELKESTRAEMEAGSKLVGGGLSPEQAYEKSLEDPVIVPPPVIPQPIVDPYREPTAASKAEMEAGRQLNERDRKENDRVRQGAAETRAAKAEAGASADAKTDLDYNAGAKHDTKHDNKHKK